MNLGISRIGHYRLCFEIGSGSSSSVWQGMEDKTNIPVAIKVINKSYLTNQRSITHFQREISILKNINHPLIAEFYEILEDADAYYIVMEWIPNGNLLEHVNNLGRYSETRARSILSQLISALEYLHINCHIVHRDLKCENVLLDENHNIKLIDFGLSNTFSSQFPYLHSACGSPAYTSPELIKGNMYTQSTDIWSLGVILYAVVVGNLPFDGDDVQRILEKIVFADPVYPANLSPTFVDLLQKMLEKDPALRISLTKIKEHPWFSYGDLTSLEATIRKNNLISYYDKHREIDREIINKMYENQIDISNLQQSLLNDEYNCTTSIYRILRRKKDNQKMNSILNERMKMQASSFSVNKFNSKAVCLGNSQTHQIFMSRASTLMKDPTSSRVVANTGFKQLRKNPIFHPEMTRSFIKPRR